MESGDVFLSGAAKAVRAQHSEKNGRSRRGWGIELRNLLMKQCFAILQ